MTKDLRTFKFHCSDKAQTSSFCELHNRKECENIAVILSAMAAISNIIRSCANEMGNKSVAASAILLAFDWISHTAKKHLYFSFRKKSRLSVLYVIAPKFKPAASFDIRLISDTKLAVCGDMRPWLRWT